MTLQLTQQEAAALVQLLDLACKAGGLQVAQVASQLAMKIDAAAKAEEPARADD